MAGIGATRIFQPEPRRDAKGQEADPFLAFNSEVAEAPPPAVPFAPPAVDPTFPPLVRPQPAQPPPYRLEPPANLAPITIGLCIGLAGIATAGVLYFQLNQQTAILRPGEKPAGLVETHGTLSVNSRPEGATVRVDGQLQGATPLTLSLPIGAHDVELQNGESTRKVPLTIAGGETVSHTVDLAPVESGFVSFRSPLNLQITEAGRALGTTSGARISLTAGRHDLDFASTTPVFRTRMTVYVTPGQTTTIGVDVPQGQVSINAIPWANVTVNGRSVGVTPLANLRLPIGAHEIVWRHPTLGERRRTIQVTGRTPVRVGMDFRQ
jgi:PEGA domain